MVKPAIGSRGRDAPTWRAPLDRPPGLEYKELNEVQSYSGQTVRHSKLFERMQPSGSLKQAENPCSSSLI